MQCPVLWPAANDSTVQLYLLAQLRLVEAFSWLSSLLLVNSPYNIYHRYLLICINHSEFKSGEPWGGGDTY